MGISHGAKPASALNDPSTAKSHPPAPRACRHAATIAMSRHTQRYPATRCCCRSDELDLGKRRALSAAVRLMKASRVMQLGAFRQSFVGSEAAEEQRVRADLLAVHDDQFLDAQRRSHCGNAELPR